MDGCSTVGFAELATAISVLLYIRMSNESLRRWN